MSLVGRDTEVDQIVGALLDGPGAVVVTGEAGIGKTAVLEEVVRRLSVTHPVLFGRGVSSESGFGYAVVESLLKPHLARVAQLPEPQRFALEVALALRVADRPVDALAVCLAVTNVLAEVAASVPAVLVVDDAQEIDAPSASLLSFVARRLAGAGLRVLLGVRSGTHVAGRLVEALPATRLAVDLAGLDAAAAAAMIRERLGTPIIGDRLVRILTAARGNTLAVLEFARAEVSGRAVVASASISDLLADRVRDQPSEVRRLLLLVALAGRLPVPVAGQVVERVEAALAAAVDAGLLSVDGDGIGFTHPLLAAAMFSGVTAAAARAGHASLAACADLPIEQRAQHAAAAAPAADGDVAALLDDASGHAERRGAMWTAGDLAERACVATPPGERHARLRRGLRAASLFSGAMDVAKERRALQLCERLVDDDTRAEYCLAWGHGNASDFDSVDWFTQAAAAAPAGSPLAAEAYTFLAVSLLQVGRIAEGFRACDQAEEAAEQSARPDLLAAALSFRYQWESTTLVGDAEQTYARLVTLPDFVAIDGRSFGKRAARLLRARIEGHYGEAIRILVDEVASAEKAGASTSAWWAMTLLVVCLLRAGRYNDARKVLDQVLAEEPQPDYGHAAATRLRALHAMHIGDVPTALACAQHALGTVSSSTWFLVVDHWTLGAAALSTGDHAAAVTHLRRARRTAESVGDRAPVWFYWHADYVEAALAAGQPAEAAEVAAELSHVASRVPRRELGVLDARARALLAAADGRGDEALDLIRDAAAREADHVPAEYGRTLLSYGIIARRTKQRAEARAALQRASAVFARLGNPAWQRRADDELARVGRRTADSGLTATEDRVAHLVAAGRTNREIALQLHLSIKTVEYVLTNVYRKLRVSNRTQLAGRLLSTQSTTPGR